MRPGATRLLTWGRNSHGQLGVGGGAMDHNSPQVRAQAQLRCQLPLEAAAARRA